MTDRIAIRMQGQKSAIAALDALPRGARRRVARKALSPAASIMNKAAKASVPIPNWTQGASARKSDQRAALRQNKLVQRVVRNSIGRRRKTYKNSGTAVEIIGPRFGYFKIPEGLDQRTPAAAYAWRLERGDDDHQAHPFMERAFFRTKPRLQREITKGVKRLIREEAKKAKAKQKR